MSISLRQRLRLSVTLEGRLIGNLLKGRLRAGLIVAIIAAVVVSAPTRGEQQTNPADCVQANCPSPTPKVDLAFIVDESGSLDATLLGQTYNVQIEGVLRALRDPSVIPRDGSIAVSVWTFAGAPRMVAPLTEIGMAADAEAMAEIVEGLRCGTATCNPAGACPSLGASPASNYEPAIFSSYTQLNQNHRSGARQALLLSSDGKPTDLLETLDEADSLREDALFSGRQLELDIILINPDSDAREIADQIVFPKPADDFPGKTLPIEPGISNTPCASLSQPAVQMDFDRQVMEFATHTRNVLRSSVAKIAPLIVNTEADPLPNTPATDGILSLRQAIELANCNGGAVTITFARSVNTISPLIPLPALTAPEIKIDGLAGCGVEVPNCRPLVTIDGSKTDTTNCEQGDGILIRSNRDVVRSLRIINFKRAGVGVEPVRLLDNVGFNRIELNRFENNKKAGVCIVDTPKGQQAAVFHNIGNTISMNNISGSETPIDLALDGPTPNDPGDPDEGPNTLLNFPDSLRVADTLDVTATASGVSLTGQVSGPTAAGAVVEIFAITSFRPVSGARIIDGVTFLKQATTNANGSFTVTGLNDSPTCGYTATVTDIAGNTSELMFPCGGLGVAEMPDEVVFSVAEPNGNPPSATFNIENTGCGPLVLSSFSVNRVDTRNELSAVDDRSHFSITSPVFGPERTIAPGQVQTVTIQFDPAIPQRSRNSLPVRPAASDTLPNQIVSSLTIGHNGCGDRVITLKASVTTKARLIDPKHTRRSAKVTLERSGDLFTATFSVYDSNKDVQKAMFELLDDAGRTVGPDNCCADLTVIQSRYLAGQSFTVFQQFDRAIKHPDVVAIRIRLFDKDGESEAVTSARIVNNVSTQSLHFKQSTTLTLLPVKIGPALDRRPPGARRR